MEGKSSNLNEKEPPTLFETAKSYLMKKDEAGNSVYDIISNLVQYLQENAEKNKIEKEIDYEDILNKMKDDSFSYFKNEQNYEGEDIEFSKKSQKLLKNGIKISEDEENEIKQLRKQHELEKLNKKNEDDDGGDDEEEGESSKNSEIKSKMSNGITNVFQESNYFQFAGIGLPEEEIYKLTLSMRKLFKEKNLEKLRFFGKIFGLNKNYLICESEYVPMNKIDQEQFDKHLLKEKQYGYLPPEQPGEGTNKWTYWVSNYPEDEWIRLPDVTPNQIKISRVIHKYFTGNLNHYINSYPSLLPSLEKHYLRAQISRISSTTVLSPKGLFNIPEEEEEEEGEEESADEKKKKKVDLVFSSEFEGLNPKQMSKLENWVHVYHHIMKTGRCTIYKPPKIKKEGEEEDEEEEEENNEEDNPNDPKLPLLKSINEDIQITLPFGRKEPKQKKEGEEEGEEEEEEEDEESKPKSFQESIPAWSVKLYNKLIDDSYGIAIVKSLRWKGAYSFCLQKGKQFGSIYIGNGLKYFGGNFTPLMPNLINKDLGDGKEQNDASISNEKRIKDGLEIINENEEKEGEEEEE